MLPAAFKTLNVYVDAGTIAVKVAVEQSAAFTFYINPINTKFLDGFRFALSS